MNTLLLILLILLLVGGIPVYRRYGSGGGISLGALILLILILGLLFNWF